MFTRWDRALALGGALALFLVLEVFEISMAGDKVAPRPILEKGKGSLRDIAFSADGKLFASADAKGAIVLWDATSFEEKQSLKCPEFVKRLAFSPDGKTLAAVTSEHDAQKWPLGAMVQLWSVSAGRVLDVFKITDEGKSVNCQLYSLGFSPDGTILAAGSLNHYGTAGMVTLWSLQDRKLYWQFSVRSEFLPESLCFEPKTNRLIISTGEEWKYSEMKVWDWKKKTLEYELKGHKGDIFAVACSPNGTLLASGGRGLEKRPEGNRVFTELILWDLRNGKRIESFEGERHIEATYALMTLAFSHDGKYLASGDGRGEVTLWDVPARKKLISWQAYEEESVMRIVFSPDGRMATLGREGPGVSPDPIIRVWDVQTLLKPLRKRD